MSDLFDVYNLMIDFVIMMKEWFDGLDIYLGTLHITLEVLIGSGFVAWLIGYILFPDEDD